MYNNIFIKNNKCFTIAVSTYSTKFEQSLVFSNVYTYCYLQYFRMKKHAKFKVVVINRIA